MFTVSGQPQKSEFDGVPKPVQIQIRKPESRRKGFQSPSPPLLLGQGHILHFAFLNGTVKSLPTLNGSMAFSMSNLSSRFAKTNFAPAFTLANWFYAYCNLSPRFFKMAVGIDHNLSPREDLSKYGEVAVREGKLSRRRLDQIRRMQSAHENSVEGFTLFVASVAFATYAVVPNTTINAICVWYTLSRLAYGAAYVLIESERLSIVRSAIWWSCNASCIMGLVLAARVL